MQQPEVLSSMHARGGPDREGVLDLDLLGVRDGDRVREGDSTLEAHLALLQAHTCVGLGTKGLQGQGGYTPGRGRGRASAGWGSDLVEETAATSS